MPTRDEIAAYRAALSGGGGYYQPPRYSDYGGGYGGGTLGELIGRQGQMQAQYQLASADRLGRAVQDAGRAVGDYFTQREEKKAMAAREAATLQAIEGWDGRNPMELFAGMQKIRGPHGDALQYTNTVLALRGGERKDPTQELERLGKVAQFMADQPDEVVARGWPHVRQSFGATAERLGIPLPEQWDPKERGVLGKIGEVFGPKKEARKLQTLSPGQVAFDEATGEIVAKGQEKPAEPKVVKTYGPDGRPIEKAVTPEELAKGVPAYVEPKAPREPKEEQLVQIDVNGVPTYVPRSQAVGKPAAQAARGATGSERQALNYYNRAREASEDVLAVEDKVTGAGPLGRAQLQYAPNFMQTGEQQRYRQAQRAFTEARLRKESGATIKEEEYENDAKTYFAQPGDSEEVKAQKRASRQEVLQGLGFSAGRAYEEFYGAPLETPRRAGGIRPIPDKPKAPKAGDVVRGYRYKGGDPSSPSSWEQVK